MLAITLICIPIYAAMYSKTKILQLVHAINVPNIIWALHDIEIVMLV